MKEDSKTLNSPEPFGSPAEEAVFLQGKKAIRSLYEAFRLKKTAKTPRELAEAIVRSEEHQIREMLNDGVRQVEIAKYLVKSVPSISKKEIQAALEALRSRMLREKKKRTDEQAPPENQDWK